MSVASPRWVACSNCFIDRTRKLLADPAGNTRAKLVKKVAKQGRNFIEVCLPLRIRASRDVQTIPRSEIRHRSCRLRPGNIESRNVHFDLFPLVLLSLFYALPCAWIVHI